MEHMTGSREGPAAACQRHSRKYRRMQCPDSIPGADCCKTRARHWVGQIRSPGSLKRPEWGSEWESRCVEYSWASWRASRASMACTPSGYGLFVGRPEEGSGQKWPDVQRAAEQLALALRTRDPRCQSLARHRRGPFLCHWRQLSYP